ncbi:MAG TPA: hypothetical protein VGN26_21070, partial [Armatimonadota bacterium]
APEGAADPGVTDEARKALAGGIEEAGWQQVQVPGPWSSYGEGWKSAGEAVFRRTVEVPAGWVGCTLQLDLGGIQATDTVTFDGHPIGATDPGAAAGSLPKRLYTVPAGLVKAGQSVLAVRVWSPTPAGGLRGTGAATAQPEDLSLSANPFYHPDYRRDYELGDDPYRYYRW